MENINTFQYNDEKCILLSNTKHIYDLVYFRNSLKVSFTDFQLPSYVSGLRSWELPSAPPHVKISLCF